MDFTRVIVIGDAFSPISFNFVVPIAQERVDINAAEMPIISFKAAPYNKYGAAVMPACSIIFKQ